MEAAGKMTLRGGPPSRVWEGAAHVRGLAEREFKNSCASTCIRVLFGCLVSHGSVLPEGSRGYFCCIVLSTGERTEA